MPIAAVALAALVAAARAVPTGDLCAGSRNHSAPWVNGTPPVLTGCRPHPSAEGRGRHGFPAVFPSHGAAIPTGNRFSDLCVVGSCQLASATGPGACANVTTRFRSLHKDRFRIKVQMCPGLGLAGGPPPPLPQPPAAPTADLAGLRGPGPMEGCTSCNSCDPMGAAHSPLCQLLASG